MKEILNEYGMLLLACFAGVATVTVNMMVFFGPLREELMMVVSAL